MTGRDNRKPRLAMPRWLLVLIVGLLSISEVAVGAQGMDPLPLEESTGLTSTVFASGLNFPAGLAILPDGSLLVGTSRPDFGGFYASVGELIRLVDADSDGVADEPYEVVATDLAGSVTAVAIAGDLVFVTSAASGQERIAVLRGGDWTGPYPVVGEIRFTFGNVAHQSYGLAVRPSPDEEGAFDLLFNIGAMGNDFGGGAVQLGGLLDARLLDSALYMTTVTDSGVDVSMTDPVQIATGLRNAAAFGFDPDTGDLWITDNGIDGLDNPLHAFSADELDLIPRSQIGGDPEDFGFPDSYVLYDTGEVVGDATGLQFAFVPTDGSENEGISSMAFAPSKFPSGFNHGIFAGFHGQFDSAGIENEENPLLYYDLDSGQIRTIVPNDAPNVGHLNSLLPTDDALFVADFCTNGSLSSAEPCGTLYKVTPA